MRFWFKPIDGIWEFKSWVLVIDRENIEEEDIQGNLAMRYLWYLVPVVSQDNKLWPIEILNSPIEQISPTAINFVPNPKNLLRDYAKISKMLEDNPATVAQDLKPRSPQVRRRRKAKEIVIARAEGKCEYISCNGMPPDTKNDGTPLFQVDHIIPLSENGRDSAENMIALCPNCHAAKTYGKNRVEMAKKLKEIALERHNNLVKAQI